MTTTSLWFIAALVVLGIELMLGTVYLLAAALGLAAGGLASWAGLDFTLQCLAVGLVTIAGCLVARMLRRGKAGGEAEALQSIDEGREVEVASVEADGSARAPNSFSTDRKTINTKKRKFLCTKSLGP